VSARGDGNTPGLIARSPLLYLGSILLGLILQWLRPIAVVPAAWRVLFGPPLVVAAIGVFLLSVQAFCAAGTPIQSVRPTTRIVQTGPHRFSRNPIYVAFTSLHLGIAFWVNSAWLLATLIVTLVVMSFGVIAREERYLERKFGDEYSKYKAAVRRWL
jgi:protein-S-isoprenylcysteine O-methyltransferase Ste14